MDIEEIVIKNPLIVDTIPSRQRLYDRLESLMYETSLVKALLVIANRRHKREKNGNRIVVDD